MYFEINVSLKGSHYFATAERSLTDIDSAIKAVIDFKRRFPFEEGFNITLSRRLHSGENIDISKL